MPNKKIAYKSLFTTLAIATTFTFLPISSQAITLDKIGVLDTNGAKYSDWWYTELSITLSGTAKESSDVTIEIDGESNKVTSDSSGKWTFNKTFSEAKDYSIKIMDSEDSYSFTLHAGQSFDADAVATTTTSTDTMESTESIAEVPDTGIPQIIALVTGGALLAFGGYFGVDARSQALRKFEQEA